MGPAIVGPLFFGYMLLMIVVGFMSLRGDYSSVTPGSKIVYRTSRGASALFYMLTLYILGIPFLFAAMGAMATGTASEGRDLVYALVLLGLFVLPFGLATLWLSAVRRLEIDLQSRTYRLTRTWLLGVQRTNRGTLDDFTGVCRDSNGRILLALRRPNGFLYAYPISRMQSAWAAEQMAEQMSHELSLPIVPIPRGMAR